MKKIISVLLLLALCIGCFVGCAPETTEGKDGLTAAKDYVFALYKDTKATTSTDFTVVSQVVIDGVTYPITWTSNAPAENVAIVAGDNGMTTIEITAGAADVNYTLTATVKDANGKEAAVSFNFTIPAKAQVAGTKVLYFPHGNQYITGSHYLYTGKNKWQLNLTENKAEAIALEVIENGDDTVTFKAGDQYLFCDATHVKFVTTQDDNTKFILEAADTNGGYFIKCAVANYNGKAQYLEVYSGYLTCYGMGDPSIYTFKLEDGTGAAGTISGLEENNNDNNNDNNNNDNNNNNNDNNNNDNNNNDNPPAPSGKVVLSFPKENKFVTGTHSLYAAKNKWQLELSTKKADAIALEVVNNSDGSVTFKAGGKYLFCDANHVKFVDSQDDNTKFILETTDGGYFIKCAVANYQGKAQYLEVFSGVLTSFGMGADTSIYTFKLENASGANGTISGLDEGNNDNDNNDNPPAPGPGPSTGTSVSGDLTFDLSGVELDSSTTSLEKAESKVTALQVFTDAASDSGLTDASVKNVYCGNSSTSGALPSQGGFLKMGKSAENGQITLTFDKKVAEVQILCHDWYSKSAKYPTNSNSVSVNGGSAQMAPYNESGESAVLTFTLDGSSNVVTIDTANSKAGTGGRIFVLAIAITFA